jgi:dihydroorotate dehydrogenase
VTLFENAVRPLLFRIGDGDAEAAHDWTLRRLARMSAATRTVLRMRYFVEDKVTLFGVDFPNRVGLAAGMDKNGVALDAWPALGFGFVEVGTVTAQAQPGNDKPRLFRLPEEEAVINRMGFNNRGATALAHRLTDWQRQVPLGISLGKSKVAPLDLAQHDYRVAYDQLAPHADYIAVNVSSPNTPGLRELQDKAHLEAILTALKGEVPVLVKLAPDLSEHALGEALEVAASSGAAGIIATNTTINHTGQTGGLSGKPLTLRAREVVSFARKQSSLPIIGVGGIMSADDAARMFDAGADLIQLYTGFIYHGPALVRRCARGPR